MRGALLLLIASACAPATPHNGSCLLWDDCGEGGACEFSKLHSMDPFRGECSFPDDSCTETGRRFGEFATAGVAGTCVDFFPSLDGLCDDAHPCVGAFDCQLGRCINVKQIDATEQLSGAVCADNKADAVPGGDVYIWGQAFIDEGNPALATPEVVMADALPLAAGTTKGPFQTKSITIGANHLCIVSSTLVGTPQSVSQCLGRRMDPAVGGNIAPLTSWGASTPTPGNPSVPVAHTLLAGSKRHSCGVRGQIVDCWGDNADGQLGDAESNFETLFTNPPDPATVTLGSRLIGTVTALTTGDDFTCAGTDADVWCWGGSTHWSNDTFVGARGSVTTIRPDVIDPGPVLAIAAGASHACAIKGDHQLWCWGIDDDGQVDGNPSPLQQPPHKPLGDLRVLNVAAGASHTCAVLEDNSVMCWGSNVDNKLGSPEAGSAPRVVPLNGRAIGMISATDFTTCVVLEDTFVHCWGAASLTTDAKIANGAFDLGQFPVCLL